MKTIALMIFGVASLYAQDGTAQGQAANTKTASDTKTTKTAQSVKSKQSTAASPSSTTATIVSSVPKDAEPLGQGGYRAVDPSGVAWIYHTTPFGITKIRESEFQSKANQGAGAIMKQDPASQPQGGATVPSVTAFPKGDEIHFEKQTPFGKMEWTKKRTDELNEIEKSALANAEKAPASGKN